eukprot:3100455-Ditylum_brightwellii.AAC.1
MAGDSCSALLQFPVFLCSLASSIYRSHPAGSQWLVRVARHWTSYEHFATPTEKRRKRWLKLWTL